MDAEQSERMSSAVGQPHRRACDWLSLGPVGLALLVSLSAVSCGREMVQKRIDLETSRTASREEPPPPEPVEADAVSEPSMNEPARAEESIPEDPIETR